MTETVEGNSEVAKRSKLGRVLRGLVILLLGLVVLGIMGWGMLAVYYTNLLGAPPRGIAAGIFALAALGSLLFIRPRKLGMGVFFALFFAVLLWYFSFKPSNDRDWQPDVARMGTVDIHGDRVTVHNVRNFDYRSETNFTPVWVDRTYRLSDLRTVDIFLSYWGSAAIAHGMVSFGFADDKYLAVSIEARKTKLQDYSAVEAFFREYTLVTIFADERDVIRLRTNFRKEDVYLYRTNFTPKEARALFLSYAQRANAMAARPEFYNALTSNCVTNVVYIGRSVNPGARISLDVLLSGYAARLPYQNGRLDTSLPFEELQRRSHINAAAQAAGNDADFSKQIRIGRPVPQMRSASHEK